MYHLAEQHAIHPGAKDPQVNPAYRQFLMEGANIIPPSLAHITSQVADAKESQSRQVEEKNTKVRD